MIGQETVRNIASLARLAVSDGEAAMLAPGIDSIIAYMDHLKTADTADVPPTCFSTASTQPFRPDEQRPSLPRDRLLRLAPSAKMDHFSIPKVIPR